MIKTAIFPLCCALLGSTKSFTAARIPPKNIRNQNNHHRGGCARHHPAARHCRDAAAVMETSGDPSDGTSGNRERQQNLIGVPPVRLFSRGAFRTIADSADDVADADGPLCKEESEGRQFRKGMMGVVRQGSSLAKGGSNARSNGKGTDRRPRTRTPPADAHAAEGTSLGLLQVPCSIAADPSDGEEADFDPYYTGDVDGYQDASDRTYQTNQVLIQDPSQRGSNSALFSPRTDSDVTGHKRRRNAAATSVAAFIDTGAQVTVMSLDAARRANVAHHIDRRYSGHATGVGSVGIVGRIHEGAIRVTVGGGYDGRDDLGVVHLTPAVYVLERTGTEDVDLLLGLDVLKDYRSSICLHRRVLTLRPERETDRRAFIPGGGNDSSMTQEIDIPLLFHKGPIHNLEADSVYSDDKSHIGSHTAEPRSCVNVVGCHAENESKQARRRPNCETPPKMLRNTPSSMRRFCTAEMDDAYPHSCPKLHGGWYKTEATRNTEDAPGFQAEGNSSLGVGLHDEESEQYRQVLEGEDDLEHDFSYDSIDEFEGDLSGV